MERYLGGGTIRGGCVSVLVHLKSEKDREKENTRNTSRKGSASFARSKKRDAEGSFHGKTFALKGGKGDSKKTTRVGAQG